MQSCRQLGWQPQVRPRKTQRCKQQNYLCLLLQQHKNLVMPQAV
jgi:hypothetical protein